MYDLRHEDISVKPFGENDIHNKVEWINNPLNNKYLHYTLPLEYQKTLEWFKKNKDNKNRLDGVIYYKDSPVGLVGLLGIDNTNKKAEYYVCLGEQDAKGKGIAKIASKLLIKYAFEEIGLNKIYLYTEEENVSGQKLFERLGFKKEGLLMQDLIYNGRIINRYVYGLLKEEYKDEI